MDEQKKRAAATLSLLIIVLGALSLAILTFQVGGQSGVLGNRFAGRQLVLLIHIRGSLDMLLAALPAILSFGLSALAGVRLKDWQFYATIAVTVAGIAMSIYLVMELSDPDQARRFWAYSPVAAIHNYESFIAAAKPFLVGVGAWFVGVLGIQLGVTATHGVQPAPAPNPAPNPVPPPGPAEPDQPVTPLVDPEPATPGNGTPAPPVDDTVKPQGKDQ
jgi:hypothetical protein